MDIHQYGGQQAQVVQKPRPVSVKRKRNTDPSRPKRPTSAYFFFVAKQREELEKQGRKITRVAEWTKEVSVKWRALTPKERAPFDAKAKVDKKRYDKQIMDYKGKDPNKPKRPMSSYFLWLGDFRAQNKDRIPENKELLRAAGVAWKALTPEMKAPYEALAVIEKKKYEQAIRDYAAAGGAPAAAARRAKLEEEQEAAEAAALAAAEEEEDDDEDEEEDGA